MINNLTKNKKIIIIIISIVLILAIATAIILPILLNKADDIGYSYEWENQPLQYDAVSKMVFNKKLSNILKYTFFITDKNNHISNGLMEALSKARIPTEKMLAFADYIGEFASIVMQSGFSIPDGVFDPDEQNSNSMFSNFNHHFMQFFSLTGFTEIELGKFLFELLVNIVGQGEYRELLLQLGREEFVTLTANTIYTYKMIVSATKESVEPMEARALQAVVYSLGSNYLMIINKMGYQGIEKLLGLSYDEQKDYPSLEDEQAQIFKNFLMALEGKVSNLLYILGKSLTNTDAYTFEQLFSYFSCQDKNSLEAKESLVLSHIGLANSLKTGIESSYVFRNITNINDNDSFINEYSKFMREYKILFDAINENQEQIDYQEYEQTAKQELQQFIEAINTLSNIKTLQGISQDELDRLVVQSKQMWSLFNNIEEFMDNTFSMVFVNFLLKIIDVQTFLENNRRIISDLIQDSLAGLIDSDKLEGIIGNNN